MSVIFLLLAVSLCLGIGFLIAFVCAVRSGQMDDTVTPSLRVLGEEDPGEAGGAQKQGEEANS